MENVKQFLPSSYYFDDVVIDRRNFHVQKQGETRALTPRAFDVLLYLIEQRGRVVEKQELFDQIWRETFVTDSALAREIKEIRRALDDDAGAPRYIETVPKRGYRFIAKIRESETQEPQADDGSFPGPAGGAKVAAVEAAEPVARGFLTSSVWSWPRLPLLGVAVLLVLGVTYFYFRNSGRLFSRAPTVPIRSLAVLPLENLSGDPEQEYFADGVTDELITQLAKISALRVTSRTSVMRYKGMRKALAEISRELNVDAVVEGTVARSPERVRVTAQVVRSNPEKHLWAERYDRPLGDTVILQGELAREIAQAIRVKLTPQEQTRLVSVRAVNHEAYEAYLRGRYFWSKRTEGTIRKAMEFFHQAIAKDPNYAQAFSGLADSYLLLSLPEALQQAFRPNDGFPKARAAANRALEIDDSIAEPHASLALYPGPFQCRYP